MATKTPNFGLNLPDPGDYYDIEVVNENTEAIEEALTDLSITKADEHGLFATLVFSEADWILDEATNEYTMTIPASVHLRKSAAFGCTLQHIVGGVHRTGTWALIGTRTRYDEETGAVVMTAGDAYDGTIVFYG